MARAAGCSWGVRSLLPLRWAKRLQDVGVIIDDIVRFIAVQQGRVQRSGAGARWPAGPRQAYAPGTSGSLDEGGQWCPQSLEQDPEEVMETQ